MSYLAYLDPQVAAIGAALVTAIGALIRLDQRPKQRIQPARTTQPEEQQ